MSPNKYSNFVRPVSPGGTRTYVFQPRINGEEAKKLYLEEVNDIGDPDPVIHEEVKDNVPIRRRRSVVKNITVPHTDKDLFLSAQNDDVNTLQLILDQFPDKINLLDDYGWSLLMIACQADSVDVVKELLNRNINTSVRDKAGNSAQSLVIKNKNLVLADLLISHKKKKSEDEELKPEQNDTMNEKVEFKEEFHCDICNRRFPDKQTHLSSTIHNINASKGRKIPANYVIPPTNKGYQLMLKEGWDKESGLGPDGSGKRYPIKTIQKKDRKGLGLDKKKEKVSEIEIIKKQTKKARERENRYYRRMEAKFRREFY